MYWLKNSVLFTLFPFIKAQFVNKVEATLIQK